MFRLNSFSEAELRCVGLLCGLLTLIVLPEAQSEELSYEDLVRLRVVRESLLYVAQC